MIDAVVYVAGGVTFVGAIALSHFAKQRVARLRNTATLIWQLKDAGRIAGPDAGSLLATLYGDK